MSAKHLVSLASRSVSVAVSEAASTAFVAVHRRARVYVPAHYHDGDARVHRELDVQEQGHRNNDRGAQSQGVERHREGYGGRLAQLGIVANHNKLAGTAPAPRDSASLKALRCFHRISQ